MNITIKDNISEVVIAPDLGASILAYTYIANNKSISIFPNRIGVEDVTSTACFPLVPFSNRIREGKFTWQDKDIQLPLNQLPELHANHGHGWQVKWQVIEQSDASVTLSYSYTSNDWPFPYQAIYRFELQNGELLQTLTLKNVGTSEMPAGLGLHPYFSRTKQASLVADVSKMWEVDHESMPIKVIDAPSCIQSTSGMVMNSHQLDNTFIDFPAKAEVSWPEWNVKADITASENCKFMVVYSPKEEDFFCVEPVTHSPDAINMHSQGIENTGFSSLRPNKEMSIWMKVAPKMSH
ncbi:aldose 1-epimerase [Thalassotalea crassostreae]|uniref:aldose 1-epimerase n=1 Tax=Thalassotalea crassostreae TaxID=1763536 RepID=UPI000839A546|nr:aldose 1-epimerase [Thalassotalea crassostreae]